MNVLKRFSAVAALVLAAFSAPALESQQQSLNYDFDIPAQPLTEALAAFQALTGWTITTDSAGDGSLTSRPVAGELSAREGLARMLVGTGVAYRLTSERSATLVRRPVAVSGIAVVGERGSRYKAPPSVSITKTETPLRDVPQSISVVTSEVISDQQMTSLADVMRYVPGATMGQGEGNRDQPTIRGNSSTADLLVDGVRDDVEYFRDLYNVERVEVPKGSNAMIFGRGAGGGFINRVTKEAEWPTVARLELLGGMHNNRRGQIDIGRGLSNQVAGRINGMYENSESYRRGMHVERYGVTPTLTLRAGARTRFKVAYEHFSDDRTADRGIPSFNGGPLPVDPATFFGDPAGSWSRATVNAVNGTLEHRSAFGLKVRNNTRFADYSKMYQNIFPGAVDATGSQVNITAYNNRTARKNFFNQTDLTWELSTGPVKHSFLAGGEIGRQSSDAYRNTGFFNNTATSVNVPVTNPLTTGIPVTFRQSATDADAHTTVTTAGAFIQDQIQLIPQVQAVVGMRLDNFDLAYHNNRSGADLSRTDQLISPRFGLVVKPAQPISVYGSYGVSYLPSSGAQFTSLTVTTQTLEPEKFSNYEIGAKWDVAPGLSLAASVYRLDRTNTSAPDPADPTHTIQTGSQRSSGLEASVAGNITREWQALLGYNYQDVKITSRTNNALPGQVPALVPKHAISLWNKYQLTRAIGLGVGLLHQSRMFAAIDDAVVLPSFTRADAAAYFRLNNRLSAQVNVENVFNVKYYGTAHSNNNITPGGPRAVRAGVTVGY